MCGRGDLQMLNFGGLTSSWIPYKRLMKTNLWAIGIDEWLTDTHAMQIEGLCSYGHYSVANDFQVGTYSMRNNGSQ